MFGHARAFQMFGHFIVEEVNVQSWKKGKKAKASLDKITQSHFWGLVGWDCWQRLRLRLRLRLKVVKENYKLWERNLHGSQHIHQRGNSRTVFSSTNLIGQRLCLCWGRSRGRKSWKESIDHVWIAFQRCLPRVSFEMPYCSRWLSTKTTFQGYFPW